jgi:hypothetical protein
LAVFKDYVRNVAAWLHPASVEDDELAARRHRHISAVK